MDGPFLLYSDSVPKRSKQEITAERKEAQAKLRSKTPHRRMLAEVRSEAREFANSLRRNIDPAEAVQQILDQVHAAWEYASLKVGTLDEDDYFSESMGVTVAHPWVKEQERLGMQVVHIAAKASAMGLAERQVRIQEAQAAIFQVVVEHALQQAGLDMDQRRKVHQNIAEGLEDIEGTATAIEPTRALTP